MTADSLEPPLIPILAHQITREQRLGDFAEINDALRFAAPTANQQIDRRAVR